MSRITAALFFIIIIASFLRFYALGQNPVSLTWDEVAWGYNAYTLGIDGKDEFGKLLPITFLESFGDYKPPLYAYLDILPVKIFGLNEFAIRFPSAFFGVATVLVTYFLVLRIFKDSKRKQWYALATALFLAISSWHIMLSRAAFEANVATFLLVTGVWLFLKGVQEKSWLIMLSIISFVLSLYTFNTARIVAPLLVGILSLGFYKQLFEMKKKMIISGVIGFLIVLPLIPFLLSPQAKIRFAEVNIFSNLEIIERLNQERENDGNALWSKALHNHRLAYAVEFVDHYLDHFNPQFLFIKGDENPKFSIQDVGQMYIWDIPFLVVGVLYLLRRKEAHWWIIPLWLLIGIIPAATARETPHALRIEAALPTFQVFVAYGFVSTIFLLRKKIASKKVLYSVTAGALLILFGNFLYFYHGYTVFYPNKFSGVWQYGYKESIPYVLEEQDKYDEVVITSQLGRPYIYYLFYTKTDPEVFRKEAVVSRDVFGFVEVEKFGKYTFVRNASSIRDTNKNILYIGIPEEVPQEAKVLKRFYSLEKRETLTAYTMP